MHNLRQYDVPLHRYMALMDLQVLDVLLHLMLDIFLLGWCLVVSNLSPSLTGSNVTGEE